MRIFIFAASRRGHAVLKELISQKSNICGILCLIDDPHEDQIHKKITKLAKDHNIPIFYSDSTKPKQYHEILKKLKPDIAFTIGWRYLIPENCFSIPKKGLLVIHDSLLPEYRGFAPMNWAIINGETKTGVTLFYIAKTVDSGAIVDQMETPIHENDTAATVDKRIISLYQLIIKKNLKALQNGSAKATPQDESLATYTSKRTPGDGEIDWNKSAHEIHNLVRGLTHPFPGAYTTLNGKKILIWETVLPEQLKFVGNIPGRIIWKTHGIIEVLTGDGILGIKSLQSENEDEVPAKLFKISVKDTFGKK